MRFDFHGFGSLGDQTLPPCEGENKKNTRRVNAATHLNSAGRFIDSRSLIRDRGRHQLVDLGAVVEHAEDEEGLVVWLEGEGERES